MLDFATLMSFSHRFGAFAIGICYIYLRGLEPSKLLFHHLLRELYSLFLKVLFGPSDMFKRAILSEAINITRVQPVNSKIPHAVQNRVAIANIMLTAIKMIKTVSTPP